MILAFIKKTQSENGGDAFAFGSAATTATAAAATDTTKAKAPVADANNKKG